MRASQSHMQNHYYFLLALLSLVCSSPAAVDAFRGYVRVIERSKKRTEEIQLSPEKSCDGVLPALLTLCSPLLCVFEFAECVTGVEVFCLSSTLLPPMFVRGVIVSMMDCRKALRNDSSVGVDDVLDELACFSSSLVRKSRKFSGRPKSLKNSQSLERGRLR